jgi:type II secretory pathway component GspD/PulD (secretin)
MNRCLCLFSLLFSVFAFGAAPVQLDFQKVPVIAFVQATYGDILGKNFVISPDAVGVDKVVTMRVDVLDISGVPPVLASVLDLSGLSVREEKGVYYIDVKKSSSSLLVDDVIEVYRPRYRSASYLRVLLSVVDKQNSVSSSGFVSSQSAFGQESAPGQSVGGANSGAGGNDDFLIFSGTKEYVDKIIAFLGRVDIAPLAVQIRAALVEVSATDDSSFNVGIALSALSSRLGVNIGASPAGSALNYMRFQSASVDAFISVMSGDTRYKIITEPRLVVSDGETGRIVVGSDVPVRGAVSYDENGNALQSIEYRSSGVIMQVSPRIYQDRVSVKVSQQISNFSMTTTSGIDSPTLIKRELDTVVDMDDGQVLVLAGLDEDKDSNSASGLPFFRWMSRSGSVSKTQLMLLLEVKRL